MHKAYFSPMAPHPRRTTTPALAATAHPTTHQQLSALQAALHGGLPPAMLRTWNTYADSDSEDELIQTHTTTSRSAPTPRDLDINRKSSRPPSVSSSDSDDSYRTREPVSTVLDAPRTIEIRERSNGPPRRFRVREADYGRVMNIAPRDDALAIVSCRSGLDLWSILPARHARARVLRKHGSPYFVVLGATHWKRHIERAAQGYLHADPRLKRAPALAIEIRGDALGKVFRILGRDGPNTVSLASARRSTKLSTTQLGVRELASWAVQMEKNVDCAMITAVVYVIEEWCTKPPTADK